MDEPADDRIRELAEKWADGTISPEEQAQLDRWLLSKNEGPLLWEGIDTDEEALRTRLKKQLLQRIQRPRSQMRRFVASAAAAIVVLAALAGYYRFVSHGDGPQLADTQPIVPGADRAFLTLADGQTIELAPDQETLVIVGTELGYPNGRSIGVALDAESLDWNTISTPNGGKYKIRLPDSSLVWLNAGSSLRFPSMFSSEGRHVELRGEAFFDIAERRDKQDQKISFTVSTEHQSVEVRGTQFNVSAYEDDGQTQTTLLEGSIHIHVGQYVYPIQPVQQAVLINGSDRPGINQADTAAAVAWKNNLFRFKGLDIGAVMKQIARWYDVDIAYVGKITDQQLTGYVSRDLPIGNVLAMLEEISNMQFDIQGRTVTVIRKP
ncbi:FecR family protein [Parapedobacter sp. 10938]|uniref:FecR family protein n=1 Tax=Parapedobacter flavus TaxID=3110225 RepID=UPI002DBECFC0|nr:FecR family protein [Parapedobacter sp. 10938]MEC3879284.1 FecR family protein [Parapedobacter sp. 10938]